MRSVSVVLILVVVVVAIATAYSSNEKEYYDLEDAPVLFEQFIRDYNRHYKDIADEYVHFQAFVVSLAKSNKLNFESPTASFGINQFADYTEEEMKRMFGLGYNKPRN